MTIYTEFAGGLKPPEIMTFNKGEAITAEVVQKFIEIHQQELKRYKYLMNAYKGQTEIFEYPKKEVYKPDNRLSVNFAKYVTDTFLGYFNGVPVKKQHQDTTITDLVTKFDNANDMEDEESELAKLALIYGRSYEFMYQDEEAQTCVVYNSPEDMFLVYDDSIKQKPLFAVRYGIKDEKLTGELFTLEGNFDLAGKANKVTIGEQKDKFYDELPVNEFFVNEERLGIFETVLPLINSFNKSLSEKANDVEYFSDSYLKFIGAELNKEDLQTIRDNRIINFFGRENDKIEVEFLDKPDSDAQTEHLLDRLQKLIFQISMVANISDESFGTSSGIALSYKLEPMSNLALAFQRKFQSALNRRYKLFFSLATNVPETQRDEWQSLEYVFTRNQPKNLLEEAQTASALMGITSKETALSVLSVVTDVQTEVERIEEETEDMPIFDVDKE